MALLLLIHPTSDRDDYEPKWIYDVWHFRSSLFPHGRSGLINTLRFIQIEYLDTTGSPRMLAYRDESQHWSLLTKSEANASSVHAVLP